MNRMNLMKELETRLAVGPDVGLDRRPEAGSLSKYDRQALENDLQAGYALWAETWVLPQLAKIRASWCPPRTKRSTKCARPIAGKGRAR